LQLSGFQQHNGTQKTRSVACDPAQTHKLDGTVNAFRLAGIQLDLIETLSRSEAPFFSALNIHASKTFDLLQTCQFIVNPLCMI
jgi:hypothetical protein